MKKFYLLVALSIILPLSIFAKPAGPMGMYKESPAQNIDWSKIGISNSDVYSVKMNDAPSAQMAFKVMDTDLEYFWQNMFEGLTPFTYEPKSNTLVYVTSDRESVDGWADCFVYLHFSNDGGKNWTKTQIYTKKKQMAFFPSVAVLNPKNATNPENFKYVVTITPFIPRPTPNDTLYYGEGNMYLFYNGTGWNNVEEYHEPAPVSNNTGGVQGWATNTKRTFAVSSAKGDHFYTYGMLDPLDGYQYGAYGLAYIDFTDDFPEPLSQIPPQWDTKVFRDPGSVSNSWNAPLRMGGDANGNTYAFVINMFPDAPEQRIPAFSKSIDNGKTWSDFQRMPFSVIRDFLADQGHSTALDAYIFAYPYTTWDAVVYGPDEFSLFIRMYAYVGTSTADAVGTGHYVEARYKNGTWLPLRRIAEMVGTPIRIYDVDASASIIKDSIQANSRYQELQAALTADGKSIVVKYIDFDKNDDISLGVLATPVTLVGNPTFVIDSLSCTDIFIGYRNIADDQWKPINNATQDKWYNKGTYIPNMVPNLSEIPVVEHVTQEFTATTNPRLVYPYFLQNIVQDRGPFCTSLVAVYDLTNPQPIRNEGLQRPKGLLSSIIEVLPFSINNISPNPANDFTSLSFNMDYQADVTINIHNVMGQFVKTVFTGNAQQGLNTINILTNELSVGAYYYTINVDGKTKTQLLNVIR